MLAGTQVVRLVAFGALMWVIDGTSEAQSQGQEGRGARVSDPIVENLETYRRADFDDAVNHLTTRPVRALSGDFRRRAGDWIDRGPAAERVKRTETAAAMSVELMAAAFTQGTDHYIASRDLVEWACERLRRLPTAAFERWFHLASIALAQGAGDDSLISGVRTYVAIYPPLTGSHAEHAARRFPGEGRFLLAHVTANWETQQIAAWPMTPATLIHRTYGRFSVERNNEIPALDETERKLAVLFGDSGVGAEARLRSGVLKFLRSRIVEAQVDLREAANAEEVAVRYLAFMMLGTIADRENRLSEAVVHFRRAHEIVPALSASLALAASLYRSGQTDSAVAILHGLESRSIPDPWELYGQRDYRLAGAFRHQMREALVRQ